MPRWAVTETYERTDSASETRGDDAPELCQLQQIAVTLRTEIDTVRIHDEFQRAASDPEIEEAYAWNVGGVRERLEGGDRRRAGQRIESNSVRYPLELISSDPCVVQESAGVASSVPITPLRSREP